MIYSNFHLVISLLIRSLLNSGSTIQPNLWQSLSVSSRPEAKMIELLNSSFQVQLYSESPEDYISDINPDLEWANEHFLERVSGEPMNPPPSSSNWKYAQADNKNFKKNQIFDHTYPERFWPRYAGGRSSIDGMMGIRYRYGDLDDILDLLQRDPTTRQAVLPIFFPEDTGSVGDMRVPCTLFYHFILREGFLHIIYTIRSCDALRHFRNDIYLTVRLVLWVIDQLKKRDITNWGGVLPGTFTMHITSFHCFVGDQGALRKQLP